MNSLIGSDSFCDSNVVGLLVDHVDRWPTSAHFFEVQWVAMSFNEHCFMAQSLHANTMVKYNVLTQILNRFLNYIFKSQFIGRVSMENSRMADCSFISLEIFVSFFSSIFCIFIERNWSRFQSINMHKFKESNIQFQQIQPIQLHMIYARYSLWAVSLWIDSYSKWYGISRSMNKSKDHLKSNENSNETTWKRAFYATS